MLARVAKIAPRHTVDDWIRAARAHGSHLTSAVDLQGYAHALLSHGLAHLDKSGIQPSGRLAAAVELAESRGLYEIAHILLATRPPLWLYLAVQDGRVVRDYIPASDLNALLWLEPRLDDILRIANHEADPRPMETMAKAIGDTAEMLVMAALRNAGKDAIHVAQISDSYGYDIYTPGDTVECLEVKAASSRTAHQFHLSRNEFDTCLRNRHRWRLVQLVFDNAIFMSDQIGARHVTAIRELTPETLHRIVPADTDQFVWEQSALVRVPDEVWRDSDLVLDPNYYTPGLCTTPPGGPSR
ncbi:DUF3883 domain-containing protein [Nocardia cyriacigeorgica]|uniref:protein NO VEIN domain-containing protein n=1 Tax=Nocardia cyriacigeorgica TaxID=135487 RepID=UPI0018941EEC|nr:DUF3883 domain-containing protein [Nocardia cyriacigeorgica]MBF6397908.1 DUF3883 domain-containing protein [Nocardia cyriacigeorgica]MBF6402435.1 DUF3883 domain-containing protein [Nocardia cyriacigeorgica]